MPASVLAESLVDRGFNAVVDPLRATGQSETKIAASARYFEAAAPIFPSL